MVQKKKKTGWLVININPADCIIIDVLMLSVCNKSPWSDKKKNITSLYDLLKVSEGFVQQL